MQIKKDTVVSFHYTLTEVDGKELESSYSGAPLIYLHGHNAMLNGIETSLESKSIGDKVSATLSPNEAYGERKEGAIHRVSINHVLREGKGKPKYRPGMLVKLNSEHGPRPVIVVKAGLKFLDVDSNHPFAGKTLKYDMEVINVRDAEQEELSHGHVHGEGGVQH